MIAAAYSPMVERKLRAAFVCSGNPRDIALCSGTPYHMLRALERHFEMVAVIENPWPRWFEPLARVLEFATLGRYNCVWSRWYTAFGARQSIARLRTAKPDIVFAVLVSPMTHLLTEQFRVVHASDTTLHAMFGYYDGFNKWSRLTRRNAEQIEAKAIQDSLLSLYPSDWARQSAIADYGASPEQALEIAWGANFDTVTDPPYRSADGALRFLFIGAAWARKGGQIAVDTIVELTRRGVACSLDIVGCASDVLKGPLPANVTFHGFVDKSTREGEALLAKLYAEAHFFFLPTQAECYGIVFAEAAHHGLPSLGTDTGGIPAIVRTGVTGVLLPPGATAVEFADAVVAVQASPRTYEAMSRAALTEAAGRLNWETWAEEVSAAVSERLRGGRAADMPVIEEVTA